MSPIRNITIEPVDPSDWRDLQMLSRETFIDTYSSMNIAGTVEQYADRNFTKRAIQQQLSNPQSQFFFAKRAVQDAANRSSTGDNIVGYLKLNQDQAQTDQPVVNGLEIERIYAKRSAIGMGIGRSLCAHAVEVARRHHKDWVWLGVWERNQKAIQFYRKVGFEKFSTHGFQFGQEMQTDHLMRMSVSHPVGIPKLTQV